MKRAVNSLGIKGLPLKYAATSGAKQTQGKSSVSGSASPKDAVVRNKKVTTQSKLKQAFNVALGANLNLKLREVPYTPQEPKVIPYRQEKLSRIIPGYDSDMRVTGYNGKEIKNFNVVSKHFMLIANVRSSSTDFSKLAKESLNAVVNMERAVHNAEKELGLKVLGDQMSIEVGEKLESQALTKSIDLSYSNLSNPDIAVHELGHKIMDSVRDYGAAYPETQALKESIPDAIAMLEAATTDEVIKRSLAADGSLKRDNPIAKIGENFEGKLPYLRNVGLENLKYKSPSELKEYMPDKHVMIRRGIDRLSAEEPKLAGEISKRLKKFTKGKSVDYQAFYESLPDNLKEKLAVAVDLEAQRAQDRRVYLEAHSYSRVFTASVYEALQRRHEELRSTESSSKALKDAAVDVRRALYGGLKLAPTGVATFKDMATSMIAADKLFNDGRASESLEGAFKERGILSESDIKELRRKMELTKAINREVKLSKEFLRDPESHPAEAETLLNKVIDTFGRAKLIDKRDIEGLNPYSELKDETTPVGRFKLTQVLKDDKGNTFLSYEAPILGEKVFKASAVIMLDAKGRVRYANIYGVRNAKRLHREAVKYLEIMSKYEGK